MFKQTALKTILVIAIAGLLFSGYLSYTELFQRYCAATALGLGSCTKVSGIPACVFGFVMYLIVSIVAIIGLRSKK